METIQNPQNIYTEKEVLSDALLTEKNATTIYNNLLAGKPTMVHYKYYKGNGTSEHWVLVIGVRSGAIISNIQFSDFTVIDPWGGVEKSLSCVGYFGSRYSMGMKTFY